jgi:hypothetical protein
MRWTSRMAERAAEAAKLIEAAASLADRIDAAGELTDDVVKQMGSLGRTARPLPEATASKLASAQTWVAMASAKPIMRRHRDATARLGRLSASLRTAVTNVEVAKVAVGSQWDALVSLTRGWSSQLPPDPDPVLSQLDIRSLADDAEESLAFAVARTGDASLPCSVRWTKTGTTTPADFAADSVFEGDLSWAAGDSGEQLLELVLSGADVTPGQETTTITLSSADGASIGTAEATVKLALPTGLPDGYPQPPRFSGPTKRASSAAELKSLIANSQPGDNRIRCAGGVNFGSVTIDRPTSHRFEIVSEVPAFVRLDTRQRDDLALTGVNDNNASSKVVKGASPRYAAAGISLRPKSSGGIWLEGFHMRDGQGVVNESAIRGEVWLRKCRFGSTVAKQTAFGSPAGQADRIIVWECWYYSDGSRPGTPPQPQANYTDYAIKVYTCKGLYVYGCLFEGGISHVASLKMAVQTAQFQNCIFMPWSSRNPSHLVTLQLGQEGSKPGMDRTCGVVTIRGCTFGSWTVARQVPHYGISYQDCAGLVFEDNLVYADVNNFMRFFFNRNSGLDQNDAGLAAGGSGIRVAGNRFLGRSPPAFAEALYKGRWGGAKVTFENNDTPGGLKVGPLANGVSVTYGDNAGFAP